MVKQVRRYDIYLVNLNPARAREAADVLREMFACGD